MTQRTEEWGRDYKTKGDPLVKRNTLVVEVVDETVRIQRNLLAALRKAKAGEPLDIRSTLPESAEETITYAETVRLIRRAGFRPVDQIRKGLLLP